MASVALRSKVADLLLMIHCLFVATIMTIVYVACVCSLFFANYLVPFPVFQSSRLGKREPVALP